MISLYSFSLELCAYINEEATNTNFIVFDLTQSGRAPTIYRTRSEHANHYATDAVAKGIEDIQHNILQCKYILLKP
jgi:hypothetical protein